MPSFEHLKEAAANLAARVSLRYPLVERMLQAGTRNPVLCRRFGLGAVAMGYQRVLRGRSLRIANMDGYLFYVNVGETLGIEPYFFGHSGTVWLTRSLVRPGDVCVDAGANAGHYTFLLASIAGPEGRVYSFEPNPEFSGLLKSSIALNGFENRVEVIEAALWSSNREQAEFHVSEEPSNSGTSSLVDHGWFQAGSHQIDVRTTTLDTFASDNEIARFHLVKIDVERAEDAVLEGARKLLAEGRIDYLIVELHRGGEAEKILTSAGYEGHLLVLDEQRLRPLREVPDRWFGDYLFRRPGLPALG